MASYPQKVLDRPRSTFWIAVIIGLVALLALAIGSPLGSLTAGDVEAETVAGDSVEVSEEAARLFAGSDIEGQAVMSSIAGYSVSEEEARLFAGSETADQVVMSSIAGYSVSEEEARLFAGSDR